MPGQSIAIQSNSTSIRIAQIGRELHLSLSLLYYVQMKIDSVVVLLAVAVFVDVCLCQELFCNGWKRDSQYCIHRDLPDMRFCDVCKACIWNVTVAVMHEHSLDCDLYVPT